MVLTANMSVSKASDQLYDVTQIRQRITETNKIATDIQSQPNHINKASIRKLFPKVLLTRLGINTIKS